MSIAVFYFVMYGTTGILMPYLPAYFRAQGFSGKEMAFLLSLSPLAMIFVPPVWGFVADRSGKLPLLLKLASLGSAAAFCVLLHMRGLTAIAIAFGLYAIFWTPVTALADTVALGEARRLGRPYAHLRLWGSVGFIVTSFGLVVFFSQHGGLNQALALAALLMAVYTLVALWVNPPAGTVRYAPPVLADAFRLARQPAFLWFLLAGTLHWAALAAYYLFFTVHLEDLSIGPQYAGLGFGLGVVAEILMMWRFHWLRERVPLFGLLAACAVLSSVRWFVVSVADNGLFLAALQTFHAFTFGAFFVGCIAHLERVTPPPLRATSRALFSSVALGLGGVLGNILAGAMYDAGGGRRAFQAAAVVELAVPLFLLVAARKAVVPSPLSSVDLRRAEGTCSEPRA